MHVILSREIIRKAAQELETNPSAYFAFADYQLHPPRPKNVQILDEYVDALAQQLTNTNAVVQELKAALEKATGQKVVLTIQQGPVKP